MPIFIGIQGIHTSKQHRFRRFKPWLRINLLPGFKKCVSNSSLLYFFHITYCITNLPRSELLLRIEFGLEDADIKNLVVFTKCATCDCYVLLEPPPENVKETYHVLAIHEPTVQHKKFQLVIKRSYSRRWYFLDDSFENGLYIKSSFSTNFADFFIELKLLPYLSFHFFDFADHIDFIHHRYDVEMLSFCQLIVG